MRHLHTTWYTSHRAQAASGRSTILSNIFVLDQTIRAWQKMCQFNFCCLEHWRKQRTNILHPFWDAISLRLHLFTSHTHAVNLRWFYYVRRYNCAMYFHESIDKMSSSADIDTHTSTHKRSCAAYVVVAIEPIAFMRWSFFSPLFAFMPKRDFYFSSSSAKQRRWWRQSKHQ